MKLKYYLRGLGIGIVVTAVVLGASGPDASNTKNAPEADDTQVLADLATVEESTEGQTEKEESRPMDDSSETKSDDEDIEQETPENFQSETDEPVQQPETAVEDVQEEMETEENSSETLASQPSNSEQIEITISHGDGSGTVSRKLAEAGLVESAAAYDQFLCQNGYDKKLAAGVHKIPKDATEDEIARLLCRRN